MSQEDIREFGMIPEFIGRFPVITNVHGLKREDLRKIICEPEDNILSQYKTLFALDNIDFNMSDNAIDYIAAIAEYLGTGARSLRSIFETVLSPLMFDLAGSDTKSYVLTTNDIDKNISKRYGNIKDKLENVEYDIEIKKNSAKTKQENKEIVLGNKTITNDNGFTYTAKHIKK